MILFFDPHLRMCLLIFREREREGEREGVGRERAGEKERNINVRDKHGPLPPINAHPEIKPET